MSRNFVPAVLAIAMGIGTGYYTFQPALRELRIEQAEKAPVPDHQRLQKQAQGPAPATPSAGEKVDGKVV